MKGSGGLGDYLLELGSALALDKVDLYRSKGLSLCALR